MSTAATTTPYNSLSSQSQGTTGKVDSSQIGSIPSSQEAKLNELLKTFRELVSADINPAAGAAGVIPLTNLSLVEAPNEPETVSSVKKSTSSGAGGLSNAQCSYIAVPALGNAQAPLQSTMDIVTGSEIYKLVMDVMIQQNAMAPRIMSQLNDLSKMNINLAMSLWRVISAVTQADTDKRAKELKEQQESAREAAKAAGSCGIATAIAEAVVGVIAMVVGGVAAAALAPETGGASLAFYIEGVSAAAGMISGAVMIADAGVKIDYNVQLLIAANGPDFNFEKVMNEIMDKLQFGIFAVMAGKNAAMASQIFNVISMVCTLGGNAAGRVGAQAAAEATSMAMVNLTKALTVLNTLTILTGIVGSIADPAGAAHGGKHSITLWQSMSMGLAGLAIYGLMENHLFSDKSLAEKMNESWEYAAILTESIAMLVGMGVMMGTENYLATKNLQQDTSILQNSKSFHQFSVASMANQNINMMGQTTQNVVLGLESSNLTRLTSVWNFSTEQLAVLKKNVELMSNVATANSKSLMKEATINVTQNLNNLFATVKETFQSQARAYINMKN